MHKDELTRPVRTRGALRLGTPGQTSPPVRARGTAVRTRGAVVRTTGPSGAGRIETLTGLVKDLREATGEMPLTILVHGSATAAAREFLKNLAPKLQRLDAVWLIGSGPAPAAPLPPEFDEATMLDPSGDIDDPIRGTDRRIYENLVCDLVFFPATASDDVREVDQWRRRTSALVFDGRAAKARQVTSGGREAGLRTYGWRGGEALTTPRGR